MKNLKIVMNNIQVTDALNLVDAVADLGPKDRNCLRLLAEEMFSVMEHVLENREATFELRQHDSSYSMGLSAEVPVSDEAREALLSLSSTGENRAHRGLIGMINSFMDSFDSAAGYMPPVDGITPVTDDYIWVMSEYLAAITPEQKKLEWDGMEKSILANFSDDVLIGVRNNSIEMIVKKKF